MDIDKLKRENDELIRKYNAISRRNGNLKDKLVEVNATENIRALEDKVETLKKELRDLQERLAREPIYADVLKELKDAKMARAILTEENFKVKMELKFQK